MKPRLATPQVLVVGATGTVGRHVVRGLSEAGARVRAMTRTPRAAQLPAGVDVTEGDLTIPETLDRCADGIDSVFLVWTAPRPFADAALSRLTRDARRIVFLSAPVKTPHPFFQQPNPARDLTLHIEALIERSGLSWTFLRPGMFAANARDFWGPQLQRGNVVRWPYLDAPTAPIDERDIAAVAVRALIEAGHEGMDYVMTGPESLTQHEQIATIGEVVSRRLRIEEMSPDDARREWGATVPLAVVNMLLNAWAAARGQPAFVTSTVGDVTGTAARTFRQWATDNGASFQMIPE